MMAYTAINAAPSIQSDSPSNVMNALRITAIETETTSMGGKTSVKGAKPRSCERMTNDGASTRAICMGELITTENAYSDLFCNESCTPTMFSTAFPAIATTTKPAKASEICRAAMAGSRAWTNQSETSAANPAAAISIAIASASGHRGAASYPSCPADKSVAPPLQ